MENGLMRITTQIQRSLTYYLTTNNYDKAISWFIGVKDVMDCLNLPVSAAITRQNNKSILIAVIFRGKIIWEHPEFDCDKTEKFLF